MRRHIRECYDLLVTAFPGFARGWTEKQAEVWGHALEDLPPQSLSAAVLSLAGKLDWPPKLSEIRKAVQEPIDEETRRKLSATKQAEHEAWVRTQQVAATKRASEALRRRGVDPAKLEPQQLKPLALKRVGQDEVERARGSLEGIE